MFRVFGARRIHGDDLCRRIQESPETIQLHPLESLRVEVILTVSPAHEQITVESTSGESGSSIRAETSIDSSLIHSLPSESINAGLSAILTLAVPGVAADSNGVFHPLGEHAETSMVVDGQPISDQQSRIFSNQMSLSSVQDLAAIPGAPAAEFGDKTSLVVIATTRSGLGAGKANGELQIGLLLAFISFQRAHTTRTAIRRASHPAIFSILALGADSLWKKGFAVARGATHDRESWQ